ncbi:glycosyl transferase family 2 [Skermanella stibiiresistens SB22]|uniref:Glycosyl transferase family 2 n=1 Tax=Skermanella stibiiresistens SB22 TaxID=1385369 RepID=W9H315_9PROT|nr:glycosyltransferase [Skermanella stibiiresistens]EWY40464.1 glycosyl transferase family 2 [Skermanella stibiiresistens SB22]
MNAIKLATMVKSLEKTATDRETRIAEATAGLCELQSLLPPLNQSLAAVQAEIARGDEELAGLRRQLTRRMRQRQVDRAAFTTSLAWRLTLPLRIPGLLAASFRKNRMRDRIASLEALIRSRDERIESLDAHISALTDSVAGRERLLTILKAQVSRQRFEISALERGVAEESRVHDVMLREFTSARSWRLTRPLRAVGSIGSGWWRRVSGFVPMGRPESNDVGLPLPHNGQTTGQTTGLTGDAATPEGPTVINGGGPARSFEVAWEAVFDDEGTRRHRDYQVWLAKYGELGEADLRRITEHAARLEYQPLISIVMPTYRSRPEFLRNAIDSVFAQIYPHWELCIADDASDDPEIRAILEEYGRRDDRVRIVFRPTNGHISAASNSALDLATGEFTALMDHDDVIPVHAMYMVAAELNAHPNADIVYSDEDKIDKAGRRHEPHFKPDWNFELFCAMNTINHLGVYRTALLKEIGGFREGYEGSQDFDLALRVVARTTPERIRHIPFILYHWRVFHTSGSYSTDFLTGAVESSRRALADHFRGIGETVEITTGYRHYNRVVRPVPDPEPLVSLLIPTRDRVDLLRGCVDGLLHRTDYANLEILILDNESAEPEAHDYFKSLAPDKRVRIIRYAGPFNFSAINNFGAGHSRGDILGFVNNDIEVIERGWLREMVSHAVRPNVGAVGAKLLYADGTVQHGGIILGIGGVAGHSHKRSRGKEAGYCCRLQVPQYLSAVTAACLLTRRSCFDRIGGFDAENLAVAFNDVDLCLKLREAGLDIVWTPYAELFHLESASRGSDMAPEKAERFAREVAHMRSRWGNVLDDDPCYNPNLTLSSEDFAFSAPNRARKPWLAP